MLPEIKVGMKLQWQRTITEKEVRQFAQLSGDKGIHHIQTDSKGRLLAQGLLTATLPTKLGGDLNFIARSMTFDFIQPVYSGDTLTCLGVVDSVLFKPGRIKIKFSFTITNQQEQLVLKGTSAGVIYDPLQLKKQKNQKG